MDRSVLSRNALITRSLPRGRALDINARFLTSAPPLPTGREPWIQGICPDDDANCYPCCYPKHKGPHLKRCNPLFLLALPERFELPTARFESSCSSVLAKTHQKKNIKKIKPNLVFFVGDENSKLEGEEASKESGLKVANVKEGLRSFENKMPEEFNRVEVEKKSDFLFKTEESGNKNLLNEGISKEKIFFVGNVMIDSLLGNQARAQNSKILTDLDLHPREFALLTLHRPSNVDNRKNFMEILTALREIQKEIIIVFPVHPRSKKRLSEFGLNERLKEMPNFLVQEPLGYLDFLKLMSEAKLVLTDSGGIQEETTVLGIPCLTLRENTERPATVSQGTKEGVGMD